MERISSNFASSFSQETQRTNQPQNNTRNAAANLATQDVRNATSTTNATTVYVRQPDGTLQLGQSVRPSNNNIVVDQGNDLGYQNNLHIHL